VFGDQCFQQSQEAENLCGLGAKPPEANDKTAGKKTVKFDCNRYYLPILFHQSTAVRCSVIVFNQKHSVRQSLTAV